ncbi:10 kDa chaperonin [Planctomycetes bacterium Pan216]|uniref:Co-chaperonin GroES n=1 Tax=Kolteria novifilia TaxID=2527975 RepID=A0A518B3X5_9BACT|nr:10 kDa chaperonin [Planctomycetes bacterium Pan216]
MNIKPLGDRVLVEREAAEEKTAGGILLPENAKEKPQQGKVLAVGDGKVLADGSRKELQVKVGDTVFFTTWAGDEYKSNGQSVLLMREEDILAIVE